MGGGLLILLLGVAVGYAARGTMRVSRLASAHCLTRQLSAADAGFAGVGPATPEPSGAARPEPRAEKRSGATGYAAQRSPEMEGT